MPDTFAYTIVMYVRHTVYAIGIGSTSTDYECEVARSLSLAVGSGGAEQKTRLGFYGLVANVYIVTDNDL